VDGCVGDGRNQPGATGIRVLERSPPQTATPIYEGLDGEESTVVEIGGKLGPHDSLLMR